MEKNLKFSIINLKSGILRVFRRDDGEILGGKTLGGIQSTDGWAGLPKGQARPLVMAGFRGGSRNAPP